MTKQGKSAPSHWILIRLNVLLKDCLDSCLNVSSCEKCFHLEATVLAVSLLYPRQAFIPALFIFVTVQNTYCTHLFFLVTKDYSVEPFSQYLDKKSNYANILDVHETFDPGIPCQGYFSCSSPCPSFYQSL